MEHRPFPALQTTRCLLVEPSEAHVHEIFEIFSDRETMRYMQSPPLTDLQACLETLDQWHQAWQAGKAIRWIAARREAPCEVLGVCALHSWSKPHQRIEMGSYFRRSTWGQGYSSETSQALMAFAFHHLGVHRVELRCDPGNAASTAIARKLGMRFEGTLRDFVQVQGRGFVDESVYARLRSEFQGEEPPTLP